MYSCLPSGKSVPR